MTRPFRVRVPFFGLDLCSGLTQPRDWRPLFALVRDRARHLLAFSHLNTGRSFKCMRFVNMSVMSDGKIVARRAIVRHLLMKRKKKKHNKAYKKKKKNTHHRATP